MTSPRALDRATARRFLVLRHLLAPPRALPPEPESVLAVVARLGSLQFDPLDLVGRNHDLVLAARIARYHRGLTDAQLYDARTLYETYNKGLSIVPTAELPWFRWAWDREREAHEGGTFDEHAPLVEELLERIRVGGPMSSTDLEPRAAIDWYWGPTNPVRAVLEALAEAGILGLSRREGNRRIYDLTERLFPAELLAQRPGPEAQLRHRLLSRYRGHGLLGASGQAEIFVGLGTAADRSRALGELVASDRLVPVTVDGVRGERYVIGEELPILDAAEAEVAAGEAPGRCPAGVALLAPLDPLAWDRRLLRSLFDFDYVWEVYVPQARRRWGYYVLPVLFGDRIVGRVEPRFDRPGRRLVVLDLWWQDGFDPMQAPGFAEAFGEALWAMAATGGATRLAWPRAARHRALGGAMPRGRPPG